MRRRSTSAGRRTRVVAWTLSLSIAALAQLAVEPEAPAQSAADVKRAQSLFTESEKRYREGRFQDAVDLLNEAYRLDPSPVLLYNIARAYESLGDSGHAIDAYRKYLESDPKAADRGAIEQRLATLERQQRAQEQADRPAPPPVFVPSPEPAPAPPPNPVPWIVAGVGVAGLGAGIVLGVLAKSKHDAANEGEIASADIEGANATADRLATSANIAFVMGGALALGGVV